MRRRRHRWECPSFRTPAAPPGPAPSRPQSWGRRAAPQCRWLAPRPPLAHHHQSPHRLTLHALPSCSNCMQLASAGSSMQDTGDMMLIHKSSAPHTCSLHAFEAGCSLRPVQAGASGLARFLTAPADALLPPAVAACLRARFALPAPGLLPLLGSGCQSKRSSSSSLHGSTLIANACCMQPQLCTCKNSHQYAHSSAVTARRAMSFGRAPAATAGSGCASASSASGCSWALFRP